MRCDTHSLHNDKLSFSIVAEVNLQAQSRVNRVQLVEYLNGAAGAFAIRVTNPQMFVEPVTFYSDGQVLKGEPPPPVQRAVQARLQFRGTRHAMAQHIRVIKRLEKSREWQLRRYSRRAALGLRTAAAFNRSRI